MRTQFRRNPAPKCLADGRISRRSFPAGESIDNLSTKRWNPSTSSAGASLPRSVSLEQPSAAAGWTARPARNCSTATYETKGAPAARWPSSNRFSQNSPVRRSSACSTSFGGRGERVSMALVAGLAGIPAANAASPTGAFRRAIESHRMSHRSPLTGRLVAWPHLPMFIRQTRSREIRRTGISAC